MSSIAAAEHAQSVDTSDNRLGSEPCYDTVPALPETGSDPKVTDEEKEARLKPIVKEIPDGGLAAWLVVLGAWCASFCSFGWLNSMSSSFYARKLLTLGQLLTHFFFRHRCFPGILPR